MATLVGLASGSNPLATFPNCHSVRPPSQVSRAVRGSEDVAWAPATEQRALDQLRQAVKDEDWAGNFAESLTKIHMRAEWSASPERCSMLQALVATSRAKRVLEVGSFCGAGSLSLAEATPHDGEVICLELDDYVVNLGKRFQVRSPAGHKIKHMVGPASLSLESLADQVRDGWGKPFDLAVVDADKACMQQYFQLLISTPGMLSEDAVVCVDMTPFKGQPPLRYLKYGFPYRYEAESGQKEIDALRASVSASPELVSYEFGGMLVVQKRQGL